MFATQSSSDNDDAVRKFSAYNAIFPSHLRATFSFVSQLASMHSSRPLQSHMKIKEPQLLARASERHRLLPHLTRAT